MINYYSREFKPQIKAPRVAPLEGASTYAPAGAYVSMHCGGHDADERRFKDWGNQFHSLQIRFGTRMTRIRRIFTDPCVSASTVTPVDCVHTYASARAYVDVYSVQSVFYRCCVNYVSALRASKHKKERTNKKDIKMNVTALCPPGLKSHCAGLLLRKENGKCDAAKHCAEFPSIGSHSPKQYVNQRWLQHDATYQRRMEA